MRRLLLILTINVACAALAAAQTGSLRMGIQSPNAASLGTYGEVPVNLYTGIPNISIPIFSDNSSPYNLPVSLSYHGGGNKVEALASWVGLGWSLNAGGVITRTVVGLPDEKGSGYYNTGDELYANSNWPTPSLSLWQDIQAKQVDTEPDRFFFNFDGRAGQLIMAPKDLTNSEIRSIPHQKLDIDYSTITKEWTVITPDGITYIFGGSGYVETNTDYSTSFPSSVPSNQGESYISSWYLKSIEWPDADRRIELNYSSYTAERKHRSYREEFTNRMVDPSAPCVPQSTYSTSVQEIQSLKLDSIVTPNHVIVFETSPRSALPSTNDESDEYKLDKIEVRTKTGNFIREYLFSYGYFSGYGKLRLDSVQEKGASGAAKPPYLMQYNNASFPDPMSTEAIDLWGYHNGKSGNNTLIPELTTASGYYAGADRSVDPDAMDLGILERIEYPTGGYSDFEFEANDYGSVHGNTSLTGYGGLQTEELISNAEGQKSTTVAISNTDGTPVTADIYVDIDGCDADPLPPGCPYASISGPGVSQNFTQSGNHTLALDGGNYTLTVEADYSYYAKITVAWSEKISVDKKWAGGLRIQSIATYPDQTSVPSTRSFVYKTRSDQSNPDRSSGVIINEPRFHYEFQGNNCSYLSRSSVSKMPLGMTKGNLVGYKEVTVQYDGGNEGTEVYRFTTAEDYGNQDLPENSVWPFFTTTSRDWRRGLETSVRAFDSNGNLLTERSKTYNFRGGPTYEEYRALATSYVNSDYQVYHDYRVISEWMYLDSESHAVVSSTNPADRMTTTTDYIYSDPSHLQLTSKVETNSDGTQRITDFTYAHEITDDGTGTSYLPMKNRHMLSQPYSITTKDGNHTVLNKEWILWDVFYHNSTPYWRPAERRVLKGAN